MNAEKFINERVPLVEPIEVPRPFGGDPFVFTEYGVHLKQLGLSPSIDNGIPTWRLIWRPFLANPVHYRKEDGTVGLKEKSDKVRTMRFPIVGDLTEEEAFLEAAREACLVYRCPMPAFIPKVDWEALAKKHGVKLRNRYAKPALNGARDRALELFEAGYSPRQVGEQLGVDRSTASRWRSQLKKKGALQ